MNKKLLYGKKGNPLDHFVLDGGYTGILQNIGCIGDSLASGEFESAISGRPTSYHDMYEYSWGQYMARIAGLKAYNFSEIKG